MYPIILEKQFSMSVYDQYTLLIREYIIKLIFVWASLSLVLPRIMCCIVTCNIHSVDGKETTAGVLVDRGAIVCLTHAHYMRFCAYTVFARTHLF